MFAAANPKSYFAIQPIPSNRQIGGGILAENKGTAAGEPKPAAKLRDAATRLLGMGSSEGGRSPAAVSMADLIRRWRVPEFAGLGVAFVIVSLFKACFSEHEQFIPPVRCCLVLIAHSHHDPWAGYVVFHGLCSEVGSIFKRAARLIYTCGFTRNRCFCPPLGKKWHQRRYCCTASQGGTEEFSETWLNCCELKRS